jgi:hypothetical protein
MSARFEIPLPPGHWICFQGLTNNVTAEQIKEFFYNHGLSLALDHIYIHPKSNYATRTLWVTICLTKNDVARFLEWAINGDKLLGATMLPLITEKDREAA